MCFAVLWIPTVNHVSIPFENPINGGEIDFDISDLDDESFIVKVKTSGRDINIYIQEEGSSNFELFITLHYEDSSHNGMIKYSYEPKFLEDSEFGFDQHSFPEAIYHAIKGLYHIHEFHENENDSSLKPYLSDTDINIHEKNNAALRHYLKNHEEATLNLVNNARHLLLHVTELEKSHRQNETIKEYKSFPDMYIMALGYDTYIKSLFESVYNEECSIDADDKELRRRAFNLTNSIRYFKALYAYFDTKIRQTNYTSIIKKAEESLKTAGETFQKAEQNLTQTEKSSKSSTRWALAGIAVSIILSAISLILSL